MTEAEYKKAREISKSKEYTKEYPKELIGFIGFGCSFAGKWFGGYARCDDSKAGNKSYAKAAKTSILKKLGRIPKNTTFTCQSYKDISPKKGSLIYCDPPYDGTTSYAGAGKFNSAEFWDTMKKWGKDGNTVLISEYKAPEGFKTVLTIDTKTSIRTKEKKVDNRKEKLFEASEPLKLFIYQN